MIGCCYCWRRDAVTPKAIVELVGEDIIINNKAGRAKLGPEVSYSDVFHLHLILRATAYSVPTSRGRFVSSVSRQGSSSPPGSIRLNTDRR